MVTPKRKKEIREAALEVKGGMNAVMDEIKGIDPISDKLIDALNNLIAVVLELTED